MADRAAAGDRLQDLLLDAARVLMLCGAVGIVSSVAGCLVGDNAAQAFFCLLLWLLGVCFLALSAAAVRFPRAALAAAVVAEAILKHFFTLFNLLDKA